MMNKRRDNYYRERSDAYNIRVIANHFTGLKRNDHDEK